ncbi:protein RALF-like 33 [Momordica charantia]|uniref:Protein RALF-like 33 n=1 Tax=Momordica charantia TaxID=3673 RepID=A0A6J1DJJ4_MOMCH|nr:protein RALF-like 33 [Momordica charantia]
MAAKVSFLLPFCLITAILTVSSTAVFAPSTESPSWVLDGARARCHGSMAECMMDEIEYEMNSEINRRILATSNYISYEALKANTVPCSRRGASYYNCQPGAEANPYDRGCSAITRCRS